MSNKPKTSDAEQDEFDQAFEEQATRIAGEAPPKYKPDESDEDDAPASDANEEAAGQGQPAAAEDDPLKDAPESVKKAFAAERAARLAAEHSARSNAGRVSALTKKLDEVKRTPRSDDAGDANGAPGDEGGDNDGDSFGQDYPEVSDFVERRVKKLIEPVLTKVQREEEEAQQAAEEQRIATAFRQIAEVHPDFDEIRHDPAYGAWLVKQGTTVRQLAGSEDPADAIALCNLYKADAKGTGRNSRRHLVEAAEEISSKGGARRNGVPDDFDAAFDHHASNISRNRNQR